MAGRLTKVGKAFYLFTMPGHLFPDSSVLTNSAWSYLRRADFPMLCMCDDCLSLECFIFVLPLIGI